MLDSALNALTSAAAPSTLDDTPRSKNLAPKAWPKWSLCPPIPEPTAAVEDAEDKRTQLESRAMKWPRMSLLPAAQTGGETASADESFGSVVQSA